MANPPIPVKCSKISSVTSTGSGAARKTFPSRSVVKLPLQVMKYRKKGSSSTCGAIAAMLRPVATTTSMPSSAARVSASRFFGERVI